MINAVQQAGDPILSIHDIAVRLNVSDNFIYQEIVRGKLKHYSFGGSVRKRGAIRCSEQQYQDYIQCNLETSEPIYVSGAKTQVSLKVVKTQNTVTNKLNQLLKKKQA